MAGSDIRVPTDQLIDRGVYLLDQNEAGLRFGAYNADKRSFLGVYKSATDNEEPTTVLREEGLDDPFQGIFGTVVPVEFTNAEVPAYIPLQVNVWGRGSDVWHPNNVLSAYLVWLEMEGS